MALSKIFKVIVLMSHAVCLNSLFANSTSLEKHHPSYWGLGASLGYLRSATDLDSETSKNGVLAGAVGFLSWDIDDGHRLDLGLGLNSNFAKGTVNNLYQSIAQMGFVTAINYYYSMNSVLSILQ